MNLTRRKFLGASAGVAATTLAGGVGRSFASMEDAEKVIAEFGGGAEIEQGGPLKLVTPEIAENGNSVPISFSVESPMSAEDHVESVIILATDNPNPDVATFHFTPASGIAKASTRMRLAKTQDIVALAKTSAGKFYRVENNIKVTIGGCGG